MDPDYRAGHRAATDVQAVQDRAGGDGAEQRPEREQAAPRHRPANGRGAGDGATGIQGRAGSAVRSALRPVRHPQEHDDADDQEARSVASAAASILLTTAPRAAQRPGGALDVANREPQQHPAAKMKPCWVKWIVWLESAR